MDSKQLRALIVQYIQNNPQITMNTELARLMIEQEGLTDSVDSLRKKIQYQKHNSTMANSKVEYDADVDDAFDARSIGEPVRGDDERITHYQYRIMIRDKQDLMGTFTREEMDTVYRLYSSNDGGNLNQRSVSREFPNLTFRDFKRIIRAFNITKDSMPVAPHVLEENSSEKIHSIINHNKENLVLKKLGEDRSKIYEKLWKKTLMELLEVRESRDSSKEFLEQIIEDEKANIIPIRIDRTADTDVSLNIYLSDLHIGAFVDQMEAIYHNEWNEEQLFFCVEKVLNEVLTLAEVHGKFQCINICSLGDEVDGMNMQTTRGGHALPQNMNNKQQINTWIKMMRYLIDQLIKMQIANEIKCYVITDSNHSGDFSYGAARALQIFAELKYPDMEFILFEKFIGHFICGIHGFMLTHGKDKESMKSGWPLHLNDKIKGQINDYIKYNKLANHELHLVKGDLHQTAFQDVGDFTYRNTLSWFGASKWQQTNFGNGQKGCSYDIFWNNEPRLFPGEISFK